MRGAFPTLCALGCIVTQMHNGYCFVQLHQGAAVARGRATAVAKDGASGRNADSNTRRVGMSSHQKLALKQRDIPGGPREQAWTMFEKPTVPFTYVNIHGLDDQWYSVNPAAPELKMPPGAIQIPNPSNFTLVPIVVAPEDKWPNSLQGSANDISGVMHRQIFQKAASMGGAARFSPAWFMRNYRPVVAKMDRVPQEYYDYFEGFRKQGKVIGKKKAALTSLRGMSAADAAAERAEAAAARASDTAAALEKRIGAPGAHLPRMEPTDDSLALAESMVADAGQSVIEASKAEADLRHSIMPITKPAPKIWHLKP